MFKGNLEIVIALYGRVMKTDNLKNFIVQFIFFFFDKLK